MSEPARGDRWLPVLLALAGLVVLHEAVLGTGTFHMRDILYYYAPVKHFIRERLLAGELPLWTPHYALGAPFLADPGNGSLYPGNLLLLLPWPWSLNLFLSAHIALAGPGAYRLCRQLGTSPAAAAVGGLTFMLSGYLTSMTMSGTYLVSAAWLPWVLASLHGGSVLGAGALMGVQLLAGDPQAVFITALLSAALTRRFTRLAGACLLASALAAVVYLPAALLLAGHPRASGISAAEAAHWSFHPARLAELLWPGRFGDFRDPASFTGWFLNDEGTGHPVTPWAPRIYLGAGVLLTPLALLPGRGRRHALALWALAVGFLVIALGRHTPVFGAFHTWFPAAGIFRYPEKYLLAVTACGAGLVALGLDRASEGLRGFLGRPAWATTIVLGAFANLAPSARAVTDFADPALVGEPSGLTATLAQAVAAGTPVRVYRPHGLPATGGRRLDARAEAVLEAATLAPNVGNLHGISYAVGYWSGLPAELEALRDSLLKDPVRLLDALGATHIVHPAGQPLPPRYRVIARHPPSGLLLAENPGALPRVHVAPAGAAPIPCAVLPSAPHRLIADCEVPPGGGGEVIVVTDAYAEGWTAAVGGEPVRVERHLGAQRAIRPGAEGRIRLEMAYRPPGFVAGGVLSGLAWLGLLALALLRPGRTGSRLTQSEEQTAHFAGADERHFAWQTTPGLFADTERALVAGPSLPADGRLLEIGCGEGGNLHHLGAGPRAVGIDFIPAKAAHARRALAPDGPATACADAAALPFPDATFDAVLIRDLLHHVPDRAAVLREAARVLRPGAPIGIIEPNRNSPLILLQALLVPAERAVLRSTAALLRRELTEAGFDPATRTVEHAQPFPIERVLLHPGLGLSHLGARPAVGRMLRAWDHVAGALLPRAMWMYLVAAAKASHRRG